MVTIHAGPGGWACFHGAGSRREDVVKSIFCAAKTTAQSAAGRRGHRIGILNIHSM